MLSKLFAAWALMALCVAIHAVGLAAAVKWLRSEAPPVIRLWSWTRLFVTLAGWIVFLHLLEISAWAWFYVATQGMPGVQAALYFSGVTYTTTGYGDLVLPAEWRLVGAVEALTGILMCGWSTAFFVTIVSRAFDGKPAPAAGTS